jgi:hypothetical protein
MNFTRNSSCSVNAAVKCGLLALLLTVISGSVACYARHASPNTAADLKSISNSRSISDEDAAGLNEDLSSNVHAARDYVNTIARMLKKEKFDALDYVADHARAGKERFPGGAWKLHTVYAGLSSTVQYPVTHATDEDWEELIQELQRWASARPKSVTARVALAHAYLGYAYKTRGDGDANTVSEGGWKLIRERTAEARRILEEARSLPTKCPEWYVAMQFVARYQGWGAAEERALLEEANRLDPGYYYNAAAFAGNLLPEFGGKAGDTEKLLERVADRIGGERGDIFYFEVATAPGLICNCDHNPSLSWERIERGFEASEKQYGVSLLNLNRIAFLASHYGRLDAVAADKALTRIGDQWNEETWETQKDFDSVKQWATRWAPIMAKERLLEAEAEANMRTPAGSRYKASLEKKFKELLQQCVLTQGPSVGTLETLTSIGANGTVEGANVYGPGGVCVYQKLLALKGTRAQAFPPPPQAPYWVKLDLDWAEFAPVAAK